MQLIEISKEYFKIFSEKDLTSLVRMFSKDVKLRDWELEAEGIEEVLKANKKLFDSVDSISILPLNFVSNLQTVVAELEIDINSGQDRILVVDVINYNDDNLISEIRAYKG